MIPANCGTTHCSCVECLIEPVCALCGACGDASRADQQRDTITRLQGEAKVMRTLLEESLKVLSTLDPENDSEHRRLESLKRMIVAVVEVQLLRP